jgi:hypothetical protein
MTLREYSRHRRCGLQSVQYAVKTGRIPRAANGLIDSEAADRSWKANTRQTMAEPDSKLLPSADEPATSAIEPVPGMSYAQARTFKEIYEAQRRNLELKICRGELISRKQMKAHAHGFRLLRDECFNLVPRLAAQVAAETDANTVQKLLESEMHRIFDDFAERQLQTRPNRSEWRPLHR